MTALEWLRLEPGLENLGPRASRTREEGEAAGRFWTNNAFAKPQAGSPGIKCNAERLPIALYLRSVPRALQGK